MNEGTREFTMEEVREIAGETLKALGVEKVEMDEEEREVIRKAAEEWRERKNGNERK